MVQLLPAPLTGRIKAPATRTPKQDKRLQPLTGREAYYPPPPPHINHIPEEGILRGLISHALEALSRGIYWDRGSIINLLL